MYAIIALVLACVVLIAVVPALYVVRRMSAPPENSPEQFIRGSGRSTPPENTPVVVCAGASIVHGRVGCSFVNLLARNDANCARGYFFVNAGVNGDTSLHLLRRLDSVILCDPDFVIILVGTNDVICTLNSTSWRSYRGDKRLLQQPTIESYRANMQEIVAQLKQKTRAAIAVCSLPVIGEDLSAPGNERVREFNAALKDVAEQEEVAYLPVCEVETELLQDKQHAGGGRYPGGRPFTGDAVESLRLGFVANLQHYLFGRSYDAIARDNGMELKVDLLHSTNREASIIAEQISAFLAAGSEQPHELVAGRN